MRTIYKPERIVRSNEILKEKRLRFQEDALLKDYKKATPKLSQKNFPYLSEKTIIKDKKTVLHLDNKYELSPASRESKLLEATIWYGIESCDWLRTKDNQDIEYYAYRTTKYDDYKNGADFAIEFREGENNEVSCFVIDVTTSSDKDVIREKVENLERRVWNGHLSRIKYVQSEIKDNVSSLSNLPHAIIALSKKEYNKFKKVLAETNSRQKAFKIIKPDEIIDYLQAQFAFQFGRLVIGLNNYGELADKHKLSAKQQKALNYFDEFMNGSGLFEDDAIDLLNTLLSEGITPDDFSGIDKATQVLVNIAKKYHKSISKYYIPDFQQASNVIVKYNESLANVLRAYAFLGPAKRAGSEYFPNNPQNSVYNWLTRPSEVSEFVWPDLAVKHKK